ncbi:hypothetical protein ABZP36_012207 [Zizania latifolia]
MDYAAAASHAAAAAALAADPHHHHQYPHSYDAYPYPYTAYHQTAPATDPLGAASSSSYYYPSAASTAAASAAPYDHYAAYPYYAAPAATGAGSGSSGYYFSAGEAFQPLASSASQGARSATVETGKEALKNFGFHPQRYAQAAAARASNGVTPPVAAPGMHHAQWNAHFGHPIPKTVLRKHIKKKPKVVQPLTCEVCKIQCDTQDVLRIHKTGKKHKKNLEKLQDSITPKPVKPSNIAVAANMAPAAVATSVLPAVQTKKKKKSFAATPEELEVKKRRVLEAGAAQGEVKICTVCNVVVNSQKVYQFHIAGQKHQAMAQKQQA